VTALAALEQWLADVGHPDAVHEKLASLVTFHDSGDRSAARIAAMTGWLLAAAPEQQQRWSVVHRLLSADLPPRLSPTRAPQ